MRRDKTRRTRRQTAAVGQRRPHQDFGGAARVPQLKETRELFLEKGDAMDVKDKKTMEPEVDVGTAADVEEVM